MNVNLVFLKFFVTFFLKKSLVLIKNVSIIGLNVFNAHGTSKLNLNFSLEKPLLLESSTSLGF